MVNGTIFRTVHPRLLFTKKQQVQYTSAELSLVPHEFVDPKCNNYSTVSKIRIEPSLTLTTQAVDYEALNLLHYNE